jgi:hypothetical protein
MISKSETAPAAEREVILGSPLRELEKKSAELQKQAAQDAKTWREIQQRIEGPERKKRDR